MAKRLKPDWVPLRRGIKDDLNKMSPYAVTVFITYLITADHETQKSFLTIDEMVSLYRPRGMSERTIYHARKELEDLGFIEWESGKPGVYIPDMFKYEEDDLLKEIQSLRAEVSELREKLGASGAPNSPLKGARGAGASGAGARHAGYGARHAGYPARHAPIQEEDLIIPPERKDGELSPKEKEALNLLGGCRFYPFNEELDASLVQDLSKDFPEVDLVESVKDKLAWWLDHPERAQAGSNFRLQLRNWVRIDSKKSKPKDQETRKEFRPWQPPA